MLFIWALHIIAKLLESYLENLHNRLALYKSKICRRGKVNFILKYVSEPFHLSNVFVYHMAWVINRRHHGGKLRFMVLLTKVTTYLVTRTGFDGWSVRFNWGADPVWFRMHSNILGE